MRIKNARPTLIYWLVDTRTNTPFYCGKTVGKLSSRLRAHILNVGRYPERPVSRRLFECGDNVRIVEIEVVSAVDDWVAREKRWIELLRFSFPGAHNVADGGQGTAGIILSLETRKRMGAAKRGKPRSPEVCAKISATKKGKPGFIPTTETRAKLCASQRARRAAEKIQHA